jgi:hypothetical protein
METQNKISYIRLKNTYLQKILYLQKIQKLMETQNKISYIRLKNYNFKSKVYNYLVDIQQINILIKYL